MLVFLFILLRLLLLWGMRLRMPCIECILLFVLEPIFVSQDIPVSLEVQKLQLGICQHISRRRCISSSRP